MYLFRPKSYRYATAAEKDLICNGCGAADAKFDFVPDTVYGLSITPACNIHDWMYHFAEATNEEKEKCDRIFLFNMLRIVNDKKGIWMKLRRRRVWKYYKAVQMFGGPAFWEGKNE